MRLFSPTSGVSSAGPWRATSGETAIRRGEFANGLTSTTFSTFSVFFFTFFC